MKRRDLVGLLGSAFALVGCWGGSSWRQKITVTVNTPHGEVKGSSVTSVLLQFAEDTWLAPGYAYQGGYSGEAVVVEVAEGKYLFALLDERLKTLAIKLFVSPQAAASPKKKDANAVESLRSSAVLPVGDYPLLVMFTNINDPKSVQEVKPGKLADRFGAGYSLKSITLEITDEAVTGGQAENVLTFLIQENPVFVDATKYPSGHPLRQLNRRSFKTGS